MIERLLACGLVALLSTGSAPFAAPTQQAAPAREPVAPAKPRVAPELEAAFARATRDPAGVVPLIVAASAAIAELPPKDAVLLADTLEPFARRAFFGSERLPGMEELGLGTHAVEQGETLDRIASKLKIGSGLLGYLNEELDPRKLRVGKELKVLDLSRTGVELVVEKSAYRLFAWKRTMKGARAMVMCVPVGLGAASSPTPTGKTTIVKRVLHPQWTHPVTKKTYADGDPDNVLGGYWIALDPAGIGKDGIGLHGYTGDVAANWIEKGASNGCVRMLQNDIDRVFHLAVEGTSVELRDAPAIGR